MEPALTTLRCNVIGKVRLISNKKEVVFIYLVMMIMSTINPYTRSLGIIFDTPTPLLL
jgi:hypothetical protein